MQVSSLNPSQIAGSISRIVGLHFEKTIFNLLNNNINITKNIINNFRDIRFNSIHNISILLVNQINNNDLNILKNKYSSVNLNNIRFELPTDDKRAADIIILYQNRNKLYSIGIDTKKSKSSMTQLGKKSYILLKDYLTDEESEYLYKYLQYDENKKRIWINENIDEYKLQISNIICKLKYMWIHQRFDNNPLFYNHLIMIQNNNKLSFLDVEKLLFYLDYEFCFKRRTNFIFQTEYNNKNIPLVCIKPHGSTKWNDVQLTIYKKAFSNKDIIFNIDL